jgi:hypothetical protein
LLVPQDWDVAVDLGGESRIPAGTEDRACLLQRLPDLPCDSDRAPLRESADHPAESRLSRLEMLDNARPLRENPGDGLAHRDI